MSGAAAAAAETDARRASHVDDELETHDSGHANLHNTKCFCQLQQHNEIPS